MTSPIGLQLYSVREYAQQHGFEAAVRKVAAMGYVGVEPAGFPGTTAEAAGKLFKELGLVAPSAHTGLPLGDTKNEVLDAMRAIDCPRIITGKGPADFETLDKIKATCDLFNQANQVARENGMTFGIHNHWWEYIQVAGRYVYHVMLELLDPTIFFELDTYWIKTAGVDPAQVVREMGARAPFLHIKDGPCVKSEPMTAVGDGVVDVPAVVEAGEGHTAWLVVEIDRCAGDMMEAVAKSYSYLVGNGLARGSK
ncbi:MAG TPA: sugar phosphate isomerase/epimerase [Anaerolineae bacterium]|nr:sugar phosphate isomerase/epimerase [Anaerolineae bacterium]HQI84770.1 sugar phosphate isomerase/epimerase [Anaerolineae bacterium]